MDSKSIFQSFWQSKAGKIVSLPFIFCNDLRTQINEWCGIIAFSMMLLNYHEAKLDRLSRMDKIQMTVDEKLKDWDCTNYVCTKEQWEQIQIDITGTSCAISYCSEDELRNMPLLDLIDEYNRLAKIEGKDQMSIQEVDICRSYVESYLKEKTDIYNPTKRDIEPKMYKSCRRVIRIHLIKV